MVETKRVYILVKTYPTISEKYSELVCTAGILEDGSWIRLYPVPFRQLKEGQQYSKYTWVTVDAERNTKDFRPESFKLVDYSKIQTNPPAKKVNWDTRRSILSKTKIYTNLTELIDEAKSDKKTSLAIFRPTEILDFIIEPCEREWDKKKLASLHTESLQMSLFKTIEEQEEEFKIVEKIPYKFSYKFRDDAGRESTLMIEDWELGMLYLNCLRRCNYNEQKALEDVKKKYFDVFLQKDIHFFLGTTLKHHNQARNPFIIIGVFYPPKPVPIQQTTLWDSL